VTTTINELNNDYSIKLFMFRDSILMSLKYFTRFQFNNSVDTELAEEDFGNDLALEIGGTLQSFNDPTYGTVLNLNGTTSLMASGDFTNISGGLDRSFSFWAKNDVLGYNPILSYGDITTGPAFIIYSDNDDGPGVPEISDLTTSYKATFTPNTTTWSHYVITYSSGTLLYYIDAIEVGNFSTTLATGTGDPMRIGTDANGQYFTGKISDLRIYNTALDLTTIEYMLSVGPNFEEKIDVDFVEKIDDFGLAVCATMMSRSAYSVQESGQTLTNSFYINDASSDLQEASRLEYTQDGSGSTSVSVKTRHHETTTGDDVLYSSIDMNAENTTFTNVNETDTDSSSVIFSKEGMSVTSDNPGGIYFGTEKDFRMSVDGDFFVIEAYNSLSGVYDKKMEIGK